MRDPEPRFGGALSCAALDVRVPPYSAGENILSDPGSWSMSVVGPVADMASLRSDTRLPFLETLALVRNVKHRSALRVIGAPAGSMKEETHEEDLSLGGGWHRIAGCRYIRQRTRKFNYNGRVERSRSQAMLGRRQ
jgi:hypothetical protein